MGAALPQGACAARMMLFVGGPSTEGAGKVVDKELSEPIRSHEVPPLCLPRAVFYATTVFMPLVCSQYNFMIPMASVPASTFVLACSYLIQ